MSRMDGKKTHTHTFFYIFFVEIILVYVYICMYPDSHTSFILFFTCIGIPTYVAYFVCDSASEFGAMGSTSFLGVFSYPNLLLVFSEPVIFRNL